MCVKADTGSEHIISCHKMEESFDWERLDPYSRKTEKGRSLDAP